MSRYDAQALSDRQEIVDLLVDYAYALDTKDWELLSRSFTEDAEADYAGLGPKLTGGAAICADLRAIVEPLQTCSHIVSNHRIALDGDAASSTTHLIAQHVLDGAVGGPIFHVALVYHDHLRRTDQGWRIAARRLELLWTDGNASIAEQARARAAGG
ncbi:unannotated protein [freshwater metagenome]|uniref:Unannotated protein n=1 Tax=freshwater metagenome TaxID=449393 RepID=A0A6J7CP19_9ZZZZ|nr:nuclear transport factor 2 family protein [Actinomycetota bacterium]